MDFPQGFFESHHRAKDSKPNFHRLQSMARLKTAFLSTVGDGI